MGTGQLVPRTNSTPSIMHMRTTSTPSICTCGQIVPRRFSHADKQYPVLFHRRTNSTPLVYFPIINLLNACIINLIDISILFFNINLLKDMVLFVHMYKTTGYYLSACSNRRGTICPHVQIDGVLFVRMCKNDGVLLVRDSFCPCLSQNIAYTIIFTLKFYTGSSKIHF